jgi:hypothetical protein
MGGVPSRGAAITTVLITSSHADIRVHNTEVSLVFDRSCTRSFLQSFRRLCMSTKASVATTRSILGRVVTIISTGTPLAKHDGDSDHDLDLITPRMHCHCRIDEGTNCVRGDARAESPTFALTPINDNGLTTAADAPPFLWVTWHWYSVFGAPAPEPLPPQYTGRKSSAFQRSKEALAIGCSPQFVAALQEVDHGL